MSAESAQTLKYQAALARAEGRLYAVTAERDEAQAQCDAARELVCLTAIGCGECRLCVAERFEARAESAETALSEAAARNGVLGTAAQRALHPGCVTELRRNPRSPAVCYVCEQIQSALSAPAVVDPRVEALVVALEKIAGAFLPAARARVRRGEALSAAK